MSKAFTRESDDAPEAPVLPALRSALPPGAKNYITPAGAQRLRTELDALIEQRLKIASFPDAETNKTALSSPDQQILRLQHSLESAVVTPAPPPPWERVRFGATVTVRDERGKESEYRIVGVDETDIERGWVSWVSPIARALLNARLGQCVRFKFPAGEALLEITRITYS